MGIVGKLTMPFKANKYQVKLIVDVVYKNEIDTNIYPARYVREDIPAEEGNTERRYIEYLFPDGNIKRTPLFDHAQWNLIDGKKTVHLMQVSLNQYLVVTYKSGNVYVHTPVFELETEIAKDASGKPILNEQGKEVRKYIQDKDGYYVPKKDAKGRPIILRYEQKLQYDNKVVTENGDIVDLPSIQATKTYDQGYWMSSEYQIAQAKFNKKNPLEKYLPYIVVILAISIFFLTAKVSFESYRDSATTIAGTQQALSYNLANLSANIMEICRNNIVRAAPITPPPI